MVIRGIVKKISICLLLRSLCIAGITTGSKKRRLNSKRTVDLFRKEERLLVQAGQDIIIDRIILLPRC